MAKRATSKRNAQIDASQQLLLFGAPVEALAPEPGDLNIDIKLRSAISQAIRASGMDRFDIAAGMSKLAGTEVSKYSLDTWSAESKSKSSDSIDQSGNKRWGIPAELVPAFCQVTGEYRPLHIIVEALQYRALRGKELVCAKLGQVTEQIKTLDRQRKQLERYLTEVPE